jgi:hypothetical protein
LSVQAVNIGKLKLFILIVLLSCLLLAVRFANAGSGNRSDLEQPAHTAAARTAHSH